MSEVATYVYCLVRSPRAPRLERAPAGLPKSRRLRALDAGSDLWLIAADAPLPDYGEAAIERGLRDLDWVSRRAVAHEGVVAHFVGAEAVVPLKLFTLFASDARALAYVKQHRKELERMADRVAGRLEWGVRLSLDAEAAKRRMQRESRRAASGASSGAGFLLRKKGLLDAVVDLTSGGRERADALFEKLGKLSVDRRRRTASEVEPGSRLLLDAVYLVPTRKSASFQRAARTSERALAAEGYRLSVTGPWPAYNFISTSA